MTSAARRAGASEEGGATKQRAVTVTRSNCAAESIVIDDVEQQRRGGQGVRKQPMPAMFRAVRNTAPFGPRRTHDNEQFTLHPRAAQRAARMRLKPRARTMLAYV